MSRTWDRVQTVLLAVVVAVAVGLTALVFASVPGISGQRSPLPQEASPGPAARAVELVPWSIAWQGARTAAILYPGHKGFAPVWSQLAPVLRRANVLTRVPAALFARATSTGVLWISPPPELDAALFTGEGMAHTAGKPPWDRLAITPGRPLRIWALDLMGGVYTAALDLTPRSWHAIAALMHAGLPAAVLPTAVDGLRVPVAVLVPTQPVRVPVGPITLAVSASRLKAGVFRDPLAVRSLLEADGSLIYTDGQSGVRVDAAGMIHYDAPVPVYHGGETLPALLTTASTLLATVWTQGRPSLVGLAVSALGTSRRTFAADVLVRLMPLLEGTPLAVTDGQASAILSNGGLVSLAAPMLQPQPTGRAPVPQYGVALTGIGQKAAGAALVGMWPAVAPGASGLDPGWICGLSDGKLMFADQKSAWSLGVRSSTGTG